MNMLSTSIIWALALFAVATANPLAEKDGVIDTHQPPALVEADVMEGVIDSGDDTRDGVLDDSADIFRMDGALELGYMENLNHLPVVMAAALHQVEPTKNDVAEGTIDLSYVYQLSKPQKAAIDDVMQVEFIETMDAANH